MDKANSYYTFYTDNTKQKYSQKTYVVIYLQGAPASPAPAKVGAAVAGNGNTAYSNVGSGNVGSSPARIATSAKDDDPNAGAYIRGIKVTPKKTPTGIEEIVTNDSYRS